MRCEDEWRRSVAPGFPEISARCVIHSTDLMNVPRYSVCVNAWSINCGSIEVLLGESSRNWMIFIGYSVELRCPGFPCQIFGDSDRGPIFLDTMKADTSNRLRLGAFELNLKRGELCAIEGYSDRQKVLLQEQPFRVLKILIDCGGEIATREEIKKRLWPNDTVVDFDHNINVAIGTLRRSLRRLGCGSVLYRNSSAAGLPAHGSGRADRPHRDSARG